MLKLNIKDTYIGNRKSNLDRIGHFVGNDWSVSYMLDGFFNEDLPNEELHYVDSIVDKIESEIKKLPLYAELENIIKALNSSIKEKTLSKGKASAVFVLSKGENINIFYAGDTRYYLLKEKIRSKDHSQAQRMIDDKKSPEKSIYKHPYRKYITRSISNGSSISNLDKVEFNSINSLILCSDGFWSCFELEDEIYDISTDIQAQEAFNKAQKYKEGRADNISFMYLTKET